MSFTIAIDFSQFHQRVATSREAIQRDVSRGVAHAAIAGRDQAKRGGWKDRTTNLRRGINAQLLGWSGDAYFWKFATDVPYAKFVEDETRAHWIFPKAGYNAPVDSLYAGQTRRGRGKGPHESAVGRGMALRWKDGGQEIFARRVYHPGTMGFHFMRDASKHARSVLIEDLHSGFTNLRSVWAA
jgi:hypothetical protein